MSKSWTPKELYLVDSYLSKQGNSLRNTTVIQINADGTKTPVCSKEEQQARALYKELGFLYNSFYSVYLVMKDHPRYRKHVLTELEARLVEYENGKVNEKDTLYLWFDGKLDTNFYYSDENDRLFGEYILQLYGSKLKS